MNTQEKIKMIKKFIQKRGWDGEEIKRTQAILFVLQKRICDIKPITGLNKRRAYEILKK